MIMGIFLKLLLSLVLVVVVVRTFYKNKKKTKVFGSLRKFGVKLYVSKQND